MYMYVCLYVCMFVSRQPCVPSLYVYVWVWMRARAWVLLACCVREDGCLRM